MYAEGGVTSRVLTTECACQRTMEFLKQCATRLDSGEDALDVMADLRVRYRTTQCVNVKSCLVRGMCTPQPAYVAACTSLMDAHPELRPRWDETACVFVRREGGDDRDELLRTLPPRVGENVRRFTVTRNEMRACKRASVRNAISKNRFSEYVDGRTLLAHARAVLRDPSVRVPELALALMLTTGRRSCEILNGCSTCVPHAEYAMRFYGQAKKRGRVCEYIIPVLAPPMDIVHGLEQLRALQAHAILPNHETSRRYQSLLARYVHAHAPWSECRRAHSVRGVYACMAWRLFDWGRYSNAFVVMCVLGHTGLTESLVYTPFDLGAAFADEPSLGVGYLTDASPTVAGTDGEPQASPHSS